MADEIYQLMKRHFQDMVRKKELVSPNGSYAGKFPPLEVFQERTAGGGDVRNPFGKTELVDTSHGISATHQGKTSFGGGIDNGLANGYGSGGKFFHLKDTYGAVPQNSA